MQTAHREIGVPGFQPQAPTSTLEFRIITAVAAAVVVAAVAAVVRVVVVAVVAVAGRGLPEPGRAVPRRQMVLGLLAEAGSDWAFRPARAARQKVALAVPPTGAWPALRVRHRPLEHRAAAGARPAALRG